MATPRAAAILKNNGIIVHQTDTVLGLACLPKPTLLQRLGQLKRRSQTKGFILLASSIEQLHGYIQIDDEALTVIQRAGSRPTTWLVKAGKQAGAGLIGDGHKVAVRLSQHAGVKSICEKAGAIASTSANLSSLNTCSQFEQARKMFGPHIDYIECAPATGSGQPSRIIDLASGAVIRA